MSDIQVLMTNNAEPSDALGGGARGVVSRRNLFDREIMRQAAIDALRKLDDYEAPLSDVVAKVIQAKLQEGAYPVFFFLCSSGVFFPLYNTHPFSS